MSSMPAQHLVAMPSDFSSHHIPQLLENLSARSQGSFVCYDLSGVTWVTPSLLTFLCASAKTLINQGEKAYVNRPSNPDVEQYLQRMDFYTTAGISVDEHFVRHDASHRFVPLQKVSHDASGASTHEILTRNLSDAILGSGCDFEARLFLAYCIGELLNNVRQHAGEDGYVCAQCYPKTKDVLVSIADAGVGIRKSLSENPEYADMKDDVKALEMAIMPNVTGKPRSSVPYSQPGNSGNGLYFLSTIARKTQGMLSLCSGAAYHQENVFGVTKGTFGCHFAGTFVELRLSRARMTRYNEMMAEIRRERFGDDVSQGRFVSE